MEFDNPVPPWWFFVLFILAVICVMFVSCKANRRDKESRIIRVGDTYVQQNDPWGEKPWITNRVVATTNGWVKWTDENGNERTGDDNYFRNYTQTGRFSLMIRGK